MKKFISIVLFMQTLLLGQSVAQDTVEWGDEFYLFNEQRTLKKLSPQPHFVDSGWVYEYIYQLYYTDKKIPLRGVALTIDISHDSWVEYALSIGYSKAFPVYIGFATGEVNPFDYDDVGIVVPMIARGSIDFSEHIRKCTFKYDVEEPFPHNEYVQCYEIYFSRKDADSVEGIFSVGGGGHFMDSLVNYYRPYFVDTYDDANAIFSNHLVDIAFRYYTNMSDYLQAYLYAPGHLQSKGV